MFVQMLRPFWYRVTERVNFTVYCQQQWSMTWRHDHMKEMADKTGDNSALKPTNVVEINENAAGDLCENTDDKVELGIMKSASTSRFKVAKVSDAGEPSVNTNADTEAAQAHDKIPKRRNNSEHVEFNLDENKKNTDVYPESPPGSPMFYTDTTSPNDTYGYGNSFTNNHTNSKTFGKNITEALPHVDHYRNLLSATAALKSRPTLAELHEEKVRTSYWSTIAQLELTCRYRVLNCHAYGGSRWRLIITLISLEFTMCYWMSFCI